MVPLWFGFGLWADFRWLVTGMASFDVDFARLSGDARGLSHVLWRHWRWVGGAFPIEGTGVIGRRETEYPAVAVRGGSCFEVN